MGDTVTTEDKATPGDTMEATAAKGDTETAGDAASLEIEPPQAPAGNRSLVDRPIFLCGLPRTGTSLLLSLLDGHPELVVASHESKFFLHFLPRAATVSGDAKRRLAEETLFLVWKAGGYHEKFLAHVPIDEVFARFRARLAASSKRDADYLTCSVLGYGEASGQISERTVGWVEKTPYNERYADYIFASWKHAKCIHLIRDPRDVLYTYQHRDRLRGRRVTMLSGVAYAARNGGRYCRENRATYGADRYLEVRYEDLTQQPDRELRRIREFLGISDHPTLSRPTRGAGQRFWSGNAIANPFSGIDASRVGRWKGQVAPHKIRVLEAVLSEEMALHGYTPALETSLAARLEAGLCQLVNSLRPIAARIRGRA